VREKVPLIPPQRRKQMKKNQWNDILKSHKDELAALTKKVEEHKAMAETIQEAAELHQNMKKAIKLLDVPFKGDVDDFLQKSSVQIVAAFKLLEGVYKTPTPNMSKVPPRSKVKDFTIEAILSAMKMAKASTSSQLVSLLSPYFTCSPATMYEKVNRYLNILVKDGQVSRSKAPIGRTYLYTLSKNSGANKL
jgi:UDP-N-acetyl-D-mannosaminuronate dehydrogenase